ncbi:uncharacterized protein LOC131882045 isoform X1 [Tigriopus californicus]|uniref:uncharacterized protein LOC131882045 isoform X1 n=1 Tax=Tigriopus californicus TaxID=6832 RepID=UPI0027DA18B1|nr:uncharacterized protein LOC131882045 isoform X1 [Tigriopus californicus]
MASIGEYPLPWAHLWPGHGRVPMLPLTSFGNKFENALFLSSLMPRANLTTTDLNEAVCSNQNLQQNNQSEDLFFSNIMKKMAQKYQDQPEEGRFPTRSFDPFLMSTDLCRIPSPISTSSLSDHDGGAGNSSQPLDLSPSASPGLDVNDDITKWSVEEVAQFVVSIDSCQSYAQVRSENRDQPTGRKHFRKKGISLVWQTLKLDRVVFSHSPTEVRTEKGSE